jgi:uncharacterized protein
LIGLERVPTVGETAVHGAAYGQFPRVVKYLDTHGAKIEVRNQANKHGWMPLRIAEGSRLGNFKPDFDTIAALKEVMLARGAEIPPPMERVKTMGC